MKQRMVVKVNVTKDKSRTKVSKIIVGFAGVDSVRVGGKNRDLFEITSDGIDATVLTGLIRKKVGGTDTHTLEKVSGRNNYDDDHYYHNYDDHYHCNYDDGRYNYRDEATIVRYPNGVPDRYQRDYDGYRYDSRYRDYDGYRYDSRYRNYDGRPYHDPYFNNPHGCHFDPYAYN